VILRVRGGGENIVGDSHEEVPMLRRMPRPSVVHRFTKPRAGPGGKIAAILAVGL
jgi:hypothetical protein